MSILSKNYYIIPIFVPHLGCPHDCVFCNQKRITGLSTDVTEDYVNKTIMEYLNTFPKRNITVEVAFYGGSFTGIDKAIQRKLLAVPLKYKEEGKIQGIRLSTRPDYIDHEILSLLKEYKVDTIELGVQSLCDDVLEKSGRGHNSNQVYVASKLIKDYGFNSGLQMMIGLVGDNREKSLYTAKEFVKLNPYCVRIYPTLVIKDTFLEKLYQRNLYKPLTLNEAIDITTDILMLFQFHNIHVIRVGLQPTDNITLGKDVVAGPFHPSFRQLVESNIIRIILKEYLDEKIRSYFNDTLIIEANGKTVSYIAGQKSSNIDYLKKIYGFKKVKIYNNNELNFDTLNITLGGYTEQLDRKTGIKEHLSKLKLIEG